MPRHLVSTMLAATACCAALVPSAAYAGRATYDDARQDVQVLSSTPEDIDAGTTQPPRASRTAEGDVLRTALTHDRRSIKVRVRFADLRGYDDYFFVTIAGSNHRRSTIQIDTSQIQPENELGLISEVRPSCVARARHRVDYRAERLTLSYPRDCLGNPQRVRVAVSAAWSRTGSRTGNHDYVYDHAFRAAGDSADGPYFSDAIRRGR